jgi:hypothetical protein
MIIDEEMFDAVMDCYGDIEKKAREVCEVFLTTLPDDEKADMWRERIDVGTKFIHLMTHDYYGDEAHFDIPVKYLFVPAEELKDLLGLENVERYENG